MSELVKGLEFKIDTVSNVHEQLKLTQFILDCCVYDFISVEEMMRLNQRLEAVAKSKGI